MAASTGVFNWYENQTVFLTGGTGFLGVASIYKLLKLNVKRIYLLVRAKRGTDASARLKTLLKDCIFDEFRNSELYNRVVSIAGDVTKLRLDISETDRSLLQEEVTMVLHAAATVRFNEPLKKAVFSNLRAARELVELAKTMRHLQVFTHISTSYSNSDHQTVEEKVYPAKMDWRKLIKVAEILSERELEVLCPKILEPFPNTYILTKHLAETLIEEAAAEIPVVIVRPSVVIGAKKEPKPGWVRGDAGVVSINVGVGMGVLRVAFVDLSAALSYASVDGAVNTSLLAAWKTQQEHASSKEYPPVSVYQVPAKNYNWFLWRDLMFKAVEDLPFRGQAWFPLEPFFVHHFYLFYFMHIFLHILPALVVDTVLHIVGKNVRLLPIYRQLYNVTDACRHFTTRTYHFKQNNVKTLVASLSESEKKVFSVTLAETKSEIYEFGLSLARGVREKSGWPQEPTKKDFQQLQRLYYLHQGFKTVFFGLVALFFPYAAVGSIASRIISVMVPTTA